MKNPSTLVLNNAQAALAQLLEHPIRDDGSAVPDDSDGQMYSGRWWGRDKIHAERFYLDSGRKDCKVYLAFADPTTLRDSRLNVYIDSCGQTPRWYASQQQRVAGYFKPVERAAAALARGFEESRAAIPAATEDAEWRPAVDAASKA